MKKVQTSLKTWFTTLFCLLLLPENPENQNANMANNEQEEFVLSLDVGTTNIRAFIYDQTGAIRGHDNDKVHLLQPKPGWVEIDPDQLWDTIISVMKNAMKNANISPKDVKSIGISTQRSTFTTWKKSTGKPFHNLITWKDLRADALVKEWNNSFSMKGIRMGSKALHLVTRQKKYIVGGILKLKNAMVNMRLLWTIQNIPELTEALKTEKENIMFGTLECWLLFKLSGDKKLHLSTYSNAAATGIFDPFSLDYVSWIPMVFGIPNEIMPKVVDDAGEHFGSTKRDIFGAEIPIRCIMADQSASVYGLGCLKQNQIKMSLGSGSFLDVNTGPDIHASMKGLVPLIGWRIGDELVYLAEGASHDTSSIIIWAQNMGFFTEPVETSQMAENAPDTNIFFVPGFNGLQAPINDPSATAGFIGMTSNTKPDEFLRAILESIAFGMKQLLEIMETESPHSTSNDTIRIDGGVANNDFVVQLISTLTNKKIERRNDVESAVLGVAFLAGLHSGIWKSKKELELMRNEGQTKIFLPTESTRESKLDKYRQWVEACHRFKHWHSSRQ